MKININVMTSTDIELMEPDFAKNFDKFWSVDILKNDFKDANSKYIVAKVDNEIVGFAGIKVILDEADIMNIVVNIHKRNLGIGSVLIENLIQIADDLNCTTITLEVNENNIPAIRLYEKYHFERIGLRKKYYNNADDAIIMTRRITNEK